MYTAHRSSLAEDKSVRSNEARAEWLNLFYGFV
jgi:hypothetical protein